MYIVTSLWPLVSCLALYTLLCQCYALDPDTLRRMIPMAMPQANGTIVFSSTWQVLGPFQIGTREGPWGADPLEYVGGFRQLQYDPSAQFRSSLPVNGAAAWSLVDAKATANTFTSANVSLSVGFKNVNWDFLKEVYGWAAVQYQVWARGELFVGGDETQHMFLYTDSIIEYWIGGVHYFGGDAYTFRKAPPVLHLRPGTHRIDLRLWRDVRAFGGINEPTIDVLLEAQKASGTLELAAPGILMSDVIDGRLASPAASVRLRNSGEDDVEIVSIQLLDSDGPSASNQSRVTLVAGQTRPVAFNVTLPRQKVSSVHFTITYRAVLGEGKLFSLDVSQNLTRESTFSPHKVTYLHPGGIVSYMMLRPPARNATCPTGQNTLPVLIANHGAGLEASEPLVNHALDPVPDLCAWILFPTGVTPWSGDDWHNWGFADVESAANSIPSWIDHVGWQGPGVNVDRWVMTGHSNGGQGTWYALTHRPDKLVAVAPVSGYASIQKYVPYELWQPADPRRTAIISASLNSYRHEMLMENARGIPVVQQHGAIDDNVPTYHSRFLSQQLFQTGINSSYSEVPNQNHWWDTVMTTSDLVNFYHEYTASNVTIPRKLEEFSMIVGDPSDTGPKGGIRVTNLEDPGQYGRLHVKGRVITTSNVLSLELDTGVFKEKTIIVDDTELKSFDGPFSIAKTQGTWTIVSAKKNDNDALYRHGKQLGAMTAILRTHGPFIIRHQGSQTAHVALQISRNFHQYFFADTYVTSTNSSDGSSTGNVISVAIGHVEASVHPDFPIQVGTSGVTVRTGTGNVRTYGKEAVGAIFLRPLLDQKLELIVWGSDTLGLAQAARLVPTMTGVGQPDFVVLGKSARWRGVEGALALGFFDHKWEVTPSSIVS